MEVGTSVVAPVDSVIIQQGPFEINRRFCCGSFHAQVSIAMGPLSASPPLVLLSPEFFTHCQLQDACGPRVGIQRCVYSCWFHHCFCFVITRVHTRVFWIIFILFCQLHLLDLWGLSTHSWGRPLSIENFWLLRLLKHSIVRRGSGRATLLSRPLCCQFEDDILSFRLAFWAFFPSLSSHQRIQPSDGPQQQQQHKQSPTTDRQ